MTRPKPKPTPDDVYRACPGCEAQVILSVGSARLDKLARDGQIERYREGRDWRYPLQSLLKYQARKVAEAIGKRPVGRPRKVAPTTAAEQAGA